MTPYQKIRGMLRDIGEVATESADMPPDFLLQKPMLETMRDAMANASNQLQKAIEHLHPDDARGE